ncbi:MAG: NAD+ synthase [Candidatus Marinimicrobia bacterium]|nr:NAD+ synthase [Candidatus Neomarinimicrobiota bacterium]
MDLNIALSQINVIVGDLPGNTRKIMDTMAAAERKGADIVLFPELTLCAYPPQDLLLDKLFLTRCREALQRVAAACGESITLLGTVHEEAGKIYNAIAVLQRGKILAIVGKTNLPTYDVFDELRYFTPAAAPQPVEVDLHGKSLRLGIEICEDLWDERYDNKVTDLLEKQGADIILNASASPFSNGKFRERRERVQAKIRKTGLPFVYVNLVGGQDELIFDGNSFAMDADGRIAALAAAFREDLVFCRFRDGMRTETLLEPAADINAELRAALTLGIRDYFKKSGFKDALIGMSGGIDSALVAVLAVEALGAEHVYGYALPSKFSSTHSLKDAEECSRNLGMHYEVLPISDIYEQFLDTLKKPFAGSAFGLAEENLQARIRGTLLMSIANKKHALLLTTGNKTELALGYCTLYGDMCGALAPISDLNKPEVYRLARYLNERYAYSVIPENSILKQPSAELAENQFDPFDYDITGPLVDDILYNRKEIDTLIRESADAELVYRIYDLIRINEYKRRQAAHGLKCTAKAFGPGQKMPLVNHFKLH